jgi:hypothetical protein
MIAPDNTPAAVPRSPVAPDARARLRLASLSWALVAGVAAFAIAFGLALLGRADPLDSSLRAAISGLFYGLLSFHLQRVDPDDSHLQAGLVGAVCGLRSLGGPSLPGIDHLRAAIPVSSDPVPLRLLSAMMELLSVWLPLWLPLWLPIIGGALMLHGVQRWLPFRS